MVGGSESQWRDVNGVFQCRFARGLPRPSAIGQLVAALVKQAAASPVEHQFTISQVDGLWLGAGHAGKQPQKPFLGYWQGVGLAHQAKSSSVATKWVGRACRFKRRSDKEKTVASLRRQRFLFGGGV